MFQLSSRYARARGALCTALLLTAAGVANAWTDKPVRVVVPAVAGGTMDAIARVLADQLSKDTGVPFMVDNKRGAGGNVAMASLLSSRPDGQTIMVAIDNILTEVPHVLPPSFALKDIKTVAAIAQAKVMLVGNADLPAQDFKGLISFLKSHPEKNTFASYATGSTSHYAGLMLSKQSGLDLQHVPFVGSPPALVQVMGGQIPIMFDGTVTSLPLVRGGKLKAYAMVGDSRSKLLPEVPTLAELGYPSINFSNLAVVIVPSALGTEIVEKIVTAVNRATAAPTVQKRLADLGLESVQPSSIEALQKAEKTEFDRIGKIIDEFKVELK